MFSSPTLGRSLLIVTSSALLSFTPLLAPFVRGQTLLTERTEFGELSGLTVSRFARSGDDLVLVRGVVQVECRRRTSVGEWEVSQIIDPPAGGGYSSFGLAIALSGHRLAITAGTGPGLRNILVYERPDASTEWALAQTLVGVGDPQQFGHALAIAGDRLFASAPGATAGEPGAVHVFRHDLPTGLWLTQQVLTAAGSERLGESFAATPWVVVASDRTGRLVPFHYIGAVGQFVEQVSLVPNDPGLEFRPAMRFSQGELFVAVSHAPSQPTASGAVDVFDAPDGIHLEFSHRITAPVPEAFGEFGSSIAPHGNSIAIGAAGRDFRGPAMGDPIDRTGAVSIFERTTSTPWSLVQEVRLSMPSTLDALGGGDLDWNGVELFAGNGETLSPTVWLFTPPGDYWLPFLRHDCNADGAIDIADPIRLLAVLFEGGAAGTCADGCDSNDDGTLDLADAISTLSGLFVGGSLPSECAMDETWLGDALDCASAASCP